MVEPKILFAKTYHKRLIPRINQFSYKLYYLVFSINRLSGLSRGLFFGVNKHRLMSFFEKDHFPKKDFSTWIKNVLKENDITFELGDVVLMAMPRILGYVFNPVSFWFCIDKKGELRAVLAEVRNTFGESHNYLCYNTDQSVIEQSDDILAKKIFHVSPFIKREGFYKFKFLYKKNSKEIGVWIDYYDQEGKKLLVTNVYGKIAPYNIKNLLKSFIFFPFVTLKTIMMIHYQAMKIVCKGISYITLPVQMTKTLSSVIKTKRADDTRNN